MNWLFDKTFNELKLSKLFGYALGNNTKALKFYERIGFEIVGDSEPKYIKNDKEYSLKKIEMKNPNKKHFSQPRKLGGRIHCYYNSFFSKNSTILTL
jgi:hypothetical protein